MALCNSQLLNSSALIHAFDYLSSSSSCIATMSSFISSFFLISKLQSAFLSVQSNLASSFLPLTHLAPCLSAVVQSCIAASSVFPLPPPPLPLPPSTVPIGPVIGNAANSIKISSPQQVSLFDCCKTIREI